MNFTFAEISLGAIKNNIAQIKQRLPQGVKFMAVVKADAYGHGAIEVSRAALEAGVDYLSVASLKEALELRHASIKSPLLILSESIPSVAREIVRNNLTQTVYSFELLEALSQAAKDLGAKAKIHLKVDTGMGRVGLSPSEIPGILARLKNNHNIIVEGIFTHLAKAEDVNSDFTQKQIDEFQRIIRMVEKEGFDIPIKHAANSAGALYHPQAHFNMIRIGLAMYGLYPGGKIDKSIKLIPALAFKTKVVYLKKVPSGTPLSYAGTFVSAKETNIATIPVGYADGLSRKHSNQGFVLIRGNKFPIVGLICMDLCLVDIGQYEVKVGDEVVIIGEQLGKTITADEVAEREGTISYEVIAGIGKRVPRIYV